MAAQERGFAGVLGMQPCPGAGAGAGLRASQRRLAVIPGNFHALLMILTLVYPRAFSFKRGKNTILIKGILPLIVLISTAYAVLRI